MEIALQHLIAKEENIQHNLQSALDDVEWYALKVKDSKQKVAYCRKALAQLRQARKIVEDARS